MSGRYNLRHQRVSSLPGATAVVTGEPAVPSDENTDAFAGSSPLSSPVAPESASLGDPERRSDHSVGQSVVSRPPTPTRESVAGSETVGMVASNIFIRTPTADEPPYTVATGSKRRVTMEDVTDEDDSPKVQVLRRRANSTSALPSEERLSHITNNSARLSTVQRDTIQKAEDTLTAVERERIARRMEYVQNSMLRDDVTSSDSRGEGPSDPMAKGKAIDARNWGGVGIPQHELDPEAQLRELNMYSNRKPNTIYVSPRLQASMSDLGLHGSTTAHPASSKIGRAHV